MVCVFLCVCACVWWVVPLYYYLSRMRKGALRKKGAEMWIWRQKAPQRGFGREALRVEPMLS